MLIYHGVRCVGVLLDARQLSNMLLAWARQPAEDLARISIRIAANMEKYFECMGCNTISRVTAEPVKCVKCGGGTGVFTDVAAPVKVAPERGKTGDRAPGIGDERTDRASRPLRTSRVT